MPLTNHDCLLNFFIESQPNMKFHFEIFGLTIAMCTHGKKTPVFGRHHHWSGRMQTWLWMHGIGVHNFITGECTQDFSCCSWQNPEYAGFFEQLVATAEATEKGQHSGVMHVKTKK